MRASRAGENSDPLTGCILGVRADIKIQRTRGNERDIENDEMNVVPIVAIVAINGKERHVWEDGKRTGGGPEERDICDSGKRCSIWEPDKRTKAS